MEQNRIKYLAYLHNDKDMNFEKAEELGLSEQALDKFIYSLYEVEFNMEVDTKTGESWIVGVNNVKLEKPVKSSL
jgi:hypothetical protein